MKQKTIGIIGAGNMGEAIIRGLSGSRKDFSVVVSENNPERLRLITRRYRVKKIELDELAKQCHSIVICVKPQDIDAVLEHLRANVCGRPLIISIAAGVTTRHIESLFTQAIPVVRCMPNMPGLIGKGITAYCRGTNAPAGAGRLVKRIFDALGRTLEVNETALNAITALSGSGPGFIAYIADALIRAGITAGLSEEQARLLCLETLTGTAAFLAETAVAPAELVSRVASKGGTTEAGLAVLRKNDIAAIMEQTVRAAAQRAKELSR